jgi:hypothetical protein
MIPSIIASLIASFLFFALGYIWKDYVLVKVMNIIYKGVKINGTWKAVQGSVSAKGYELSCPSVYTFNLNQISDKIKGSATAEFGKRKRQIVKYSVNGTINDRFVCLSLKLQEKNRISHSNFLLEVVGNGEKMKGFMSFYALRSEEINSIEIYWEKIGQ